MKWAAITTILAVATLLAALRAAWLWWKARKGNPRAVTHIAGSADHVVQVDEEATDMSPLNAQAALWSGRTAALSALDVHLEVR